MNTCNGAVVSKFFTLYKLCPAYVLGHSLTSRSPKRTRMKAWQPSNCRACYSCPIQSQLSCS